MASATRSARPGPVCRGWFSPSLRGFPASCSSTFRLEGIATLLFWKRSRARPRCREVLRSSVVPWSLARDSAACRDSRLRPGAPLLPSAELTAVRLPAALRSKTSAALAGLAGGCRAEPRCLSATSFQMAARWPWLPPSHACAGRGSVRTGDPPWASSTACPRHPPPRRPTRRSALHRGLLWSPWTLGPIISSKGTWGSARPPGPSEPATFSRQGWGPCLFPSRRGPRPFCSAQ